MRKSGGRSGEEVEKIVADFERTGLSRREYGERSGIALPTLDWYRRRVHASHGAAKLARVRVKEPEASLGVPDGAGAGFTLSLANGCRIESGWNFDENRLMQLIRIAGAA